MKRKNRLFGVVGEAASGKDTIVKLLKERLGMKQVVSICDRGMRDGEVDGVEHRFRTPEEMDEIFKQPDLFAPTVIGKYRYCMLESLLTEDETLYIIEPEGVEYIMDKQSKGELDLGFMSIYITADIEDRVQWASKRSDFSDKFLERVNAETKRFENFNKNHGYTVKFINNGTIEELYVKVASFILKNKEV